MVPEDNKDELKVFNVPSGFNFSTLKKIEVNLEVPEFLSAAVFDIFYQQPDGNERHVVTGTFGKDLLFSGLITVPSFVDTIEVRSRYFGLEKLVKLSASKSPVSYDYNIHYDSNTSGENKSAVLKSATASTFSYMGTYTANGYPNYLYQVNDHSWESLLSNLNQTLPEGISVPDTKPAFLASGTQTNLVLKEKTHVYVTFAGEGSEFQNALGYFIYNGSKPVNQQHIIIFPNASAPGSGGNLHSGDKVLLGEFPANTEIGWFLVPAGWSKSKGIVSDVRGIYYSEPEFNPETNSALKSHMVLLKDIQNEVIVMGFEESLRDGGTSDNDFNDAVFYITLDRLEAADFTNVYATTSPVDTDGDGIIDSLDAYPLDPTLAFNNYKVTGSFGSLAFEDMWPSMGDFDFNDLVVDYSFNPITDVNNMVKVLELTLNINHIGASYHNGFAFELPVPASSVESVTGSVIKSNYLNLASNGTEAGQSNAVIFVFDDAWKVTAKTTTVRTTFVNPVDQNVIGTFPYNPFIVVNGDRGREVHLPDMPSTSLANQSWFGKESDYSNPSAGRTYRTKQNLPWAINIPGSYAVPKEKSGIYKGYLKFTDWANSAGQQFPDWYLDLSGYRDYSFLN